jgi:hypothetical protein
VGVKTGSAVSVGLGGREVPAVEVVELPRMPQPARISTLVIRRIFFMGFYNSFRIRIHPAPKLS